MPPKPSEARGTNGRDFLFINNGVIRCPQLSSVYELALYTVLAYHANRNGVVRILQATLAAEMRCSERQVRTALEGLVRIGLVSVGKGKRASIYKLEPVAADAWKQDRQEVPVMETRPAGGAGQTAQDRQEVPTEQELILNKRKEGETNKNKTPTPQAEPVVDLFELTPPEAKEPNPEQQVIDAITEEYRGANGDQIQPWDERSIIRARKEFIRLRNKGFTTEQLLQCVHNRYASDGVALGMLPETFIFELTKYLNGPLDRYNKAQERKPHELISKRTSQSEFERQAINRILAERRANQ